jgi:hypothetical protein
VRAARVELGDGVLVVGAAVVLLAVALGLQDWYWPPFGVPGGTGFEFLDVRWFTSAWECIRDGVEVTAANPCDPLERPLSYPRLWLAPADLGLGQGATVWLGGGLAAAFLVSAGAVAARLGAWDGVVFAAALCSPSVLLGLERGNPDLLVFVLVVAAVLLLRRSVRAAAVAHGLLLAAALLKLYPVLAWGPLLRRPRRRVALGLGGISAAFLVYVAVTWDDVRSVQDRAPRDVIFSYGAPILGDRAGGTVAVVAAVAAVAVALVAVSRARPVAVEGRDLDLLWAGAGVFVGTFVVAHNYNYRLAFLLLVLPQLLLWARDERPPVPFARLALTAVLASLWLGASLAQLPLGLGEWWEDVSAGFPYDELVNTLLAGYLAGVLVLTRPRRT